MKGAARLADAFQQRLPAGVEAAYMTSWRPDANDGSQTPDRDVLEAFRDPKSGLDVLVNVDMLTEGVDLPITRTVFLARPTSSEILMRQMIGRALRGPAAGGNREAFIVSFEDQWSQFRDVLSPMDLLADLLPQETVPVPPGRPAPQQTGLPAESWEAILALSRAIRASVADPDVDVFEAVPHGMYAMEWTVEGEVVRHVVHAYEHQQACWDALFGVVFGSTADALKHLDSQATQRRLLW